MALIDPPEEVPPMVWYEDGIHEGEVEGLDYFKTYYRIVDPGTCTELCRGFEYLYF